VAVDIWTAAAVIYKINGGVQSNFYVLRRNEISVYGHVHACFCFFLKRSRGFGFETVFQFVYRILCETLCASCNGAFTESVVVARFFSANVVSIFC